MFALRQCIRYIVHQLFLFFRFIPDAAKFDLRFSDQAIRLLETNVTLTIHPFVENLLKTKQFKCSLESAIENYPQEHIRYFLRVLGLLMTPCYSSNLSAHFTTKELLNIFISTAERGTIFQSKHF